jgi:protein TonB
MVLVGGLLGSAFYALDRAAAVDPISETQDAMMIDLLPVEAGGRPPGDEAPPQTAALAAAAAEPPPKKPDEDKPTKPAPQDDEEAAPPAPSSAVVIDKAKAGPAQAEPSAPQQSHETGAAPSSRPSESDADDDETRHASAHLITLWQKALMARLQSARRGLHPAGRSSGLVKVSFQIDRDGNLVTEHLAQASGSAALDAAALLLVKRAAPYPKPPDGAQPSQLLFVVPINFRR